MCVREVLFLVRENLNGARMSRHLLINNELVMNFFFFFTVFFFSFVVYIVTPGKNLKRSIYARWPIHSTLYEPIKKLLTPSANISRAWMSSWFFVYNYRWRWPLQRYNAIDEFIFFFYNLRIYVNLKRNLIERGVKRSFFFFVSSSSFCVNNVFQFVWIYEKNKLQYWNFSMWTKK